MCMWLKHKRENFNKCNKPYALDNDCVLGLGLNCKCIWSRRRNLILSWAKGNNFIQATCTKIFPKEEYVIVPKNKHLWESRWMCIPAGWFCKFVTLCWKVSPGSVAEVSSGVAGGDRALHESNRIKLQSYVSSKLHKLVQITQDTFQLFLLLFTSYLRKSFDNKFNNLLKKWQHQKQFINNVFNQTVFFFTAYLYLFSHK